MPTFSGSCWPRSWPWLDGSSFVVNAVNGFLTRWATGPASALVLRVARRREHFNALLDEARPGC